MLTNLRGPKKVGRYLLYSCNDCRFWTHPKRAKFHRWALRVLIIERNFPLLYASPIKQLVPSFCNFHQKTLVFLAGFPSRLSPRAVVCVCHLLLIFHSSVPENRVLDSSPRRPTPKLVNHEDLFVTSRPGEAI